MSVFKMYSNIETKKTIIEVWGGSTKHPDLRKEVIHDNPYFDNPVIDTIQTLLLMGSETLYPFYVSAYVKEAQKWLDILQYNFNMQRAKMDAGQVQILPHALPEREYKYTRKDGIFL